MKLLKHKGGCDCPLHFYKILSFLGSLVSLSLLIRLIIGDISFHNSPSRLENLEEKKKKQTNKLKVLIRYCNERLKADQGATMITSICKPIKKEKEKKRKEKEALLM